MLNELQKSKRKPTRSRKAKLTEHDYKNCSHTWHSTKRFW